MAVAGVDTTPPSVLSLDPADDSTNVTTRPNVTIIFDETIVRGTGPVQIRRADNDELAGSFIPANTNRVRVGTTNMTDDTLTIDWRLELDVETEYYIVLSQGSVLDDSGNEFDGLGVLDTTQWSFTTGDELEPQIVSLTPANGSTDVDPGTVFTAAFDEDVQAGVGNLTLFNGSQVVALQENFDDTSQLSLTSVDLFFSNGNNQYLGINFGAGDGSGHWGGDPNPTSLTTYTGLDGNYLDASTLGTTQRNLDWAGIDITNLTNLAFSGHFAAPTDWGPDDFVRVQVRIDGGGFTELIEIRGDGDDVPREELTGDGLGDGIGLNTDAKRFNIPISGTGTSLDLRLVVRVSSGNERFAADTIVVSGIAGVPTQVEQVPIGDATIELAGNTLSYDPVASLSVLQDYFIVIDDGAITDASANANALNDLAASSVWNFTTGDFGALVVRKETLPDGSKQRFSFSGDATGEIGDGEQITVFNLLPGTYSVTEAVPVGWLLEAIECDDTNSTGDLVSATATFRIEPSEIVECIFTNRRPMFTIGGTVSGLAAESSVTLQNNGGDDLVVDANGNFTFTTPVFDLADYTVTVVAQPDTPLQRCAVASGTGQVNGGNVTTVVVDCALAYTVGGTAIGLQLPGLVLELNETSMLMFDQDAAYQFTDRLVDGDSFNVIALLAPDDHDCQLSNSAGVIAGNNITDANVSCTTDIFFSDGFESLSEDPIPLD
ncbi:MAG: Ig-like domain-containing protein [Pseudomonadota bacterium]